MAAARGGVLEQTVIAGDPDGDALMPVGVGADERPGEELRRGEKSSREPGDDEHGASAGGRRCSVPLQVKQAEEGEAEDQVRAQLERKLPQEHHQSTQRVAAVPLKQTSGSSKDSASTWAKKTEPDTV